MVSQNTPTSTDVAASVPLFSNENYKEIQSFSDAMALAQSSFGALVTADDLGDGFQLCEDKNQLVGVPMVVLAVFLRSGDLGEYIVARAVTEDNRKVVIVDGGTGLAVQLKEYMDSHDGQWPQLWKRGLRVSKYTYEVEDKKTGEVRNAPAETFYLDTSA